VLLVSFLRYAYNSRTVRDANVFPITVAKNCVEPRVNRVPLPFILPVYLVCDWIYEYYLRSHGVFDGKVRSHLRYVQLPRIILSTGIRRSLSLIPGRERVPDEESGLTEHLETDKFLVDPTYV